MEPHFWHDRWQRQQIGFHQPQINPFLVKHWPALQADAGQVFVPLCGKTLDLHYLVEQGHPVLGNEFNQLAVEQFFAESQLQPHIDQSTGIPCYQHGDYQLLQGDFFALTAEQLQQCSHFYDRGALVALPEEMRQRYAAHLKAILPAGCSGLAIVLDYPQALLSGPPFAISEAWLNQHLGDAFTIKQLASYDVLADNGKFVSNGVPWLRENVYQLTRN